MVSFSQRILQNDTSASKPIEITYSVNPGNITEGQFVEYKRDTCIDITDTNSNISYKMCFLPYIDQENTFIGAKSKSTVFSGEFSGCYMVCFECNTEKSGRRDLFVAHIYKGGTNDTIKNWNKFVDDYETRGSHKSTGGFNPKENIASENGLEFEERLRYRDFNFITGFSPFGEYIDFMENPPQSSDETKSPKKLTHAELNTYMHDNKIKIFGVFDFNYKPAKKYVLAFSMKSKDSYHLELKREVSCSKCFDISGRIIV